MKSVHCIHCGKRLVADEVALNQRLLGVQIGSFFCLNCLSRKLQTPQDKLEILISRFKEMGCAYFTRLTEVYPDEKTNDDR